MFFLAASTVLKTDRRTPDIHTKPRGWRLLVLVLRLDGAESSRRVGLQHALLVKQGETGRHNTITASATGLAFSASSLAVTTPVESRTHLISTSG